MTTTTTVSEQDVALPDGRTLHIYDTGPGAADRTVVWHHGTPNVGLPPTPLFAHVGGARHPLGLLRPSRLRRFHAEPGGRDVASAAHDVARSSTP